MIFCLILVPITGTIMCLFISGRVVHSYVGFAFDSAERLYVGKNTGIEVYENGNKIRTIRPPSSRSYIFTISDDRIVASTGQSVRIMDLEGELIDQKTDDGSTFRKMYANSSKFVTLSGRQYSKGSIFGYYRITRDDGVCIYSMPLFDYIVNVLFEACGVSTMIFVIVLLVKLKIIKIGEK